MQPPISTPERLQTERVLILEKEYLFYGNTTLERIIESVVIIRFLFFVLQNKLCLKLKLNGEKNVL